MCCSNNGAWKREVVPDHKFDFIDVHEFHTTTFLTRLQYLWLWLLFAKSIAVYIADIYTAVALLASNRWSAAILQSEAANNGTKASNLLEVPFSIGKWVFTACIIVSFLLLAWEARKSRAIVKSRDISYAFTNVMSQNWYSLRSYDHFCFFCQIDNSKKKKDEVAFFVFFTFKGWKRLLIADAPRQVINAITLYSFGKSENWTTDLSVYFGGSILKSMVIITMLFTVVMWAGSALLLLIAATMYVPLLCYIQGNLKEYCCHKVDKRIAELMKRKNRRRLAKEAEIARKEAQGDYSHLRDKKTGKLTAAPLPQPTLPKIDLYAESDASSVTEHGNGAPSSQFSYPPAAQASSWETRPAYGVQHKSSLSRPAYPYQQSDPDLQSTHGFNESVTSLDGFASRGAPMPYDSSLDLSRSAGSSSAPMERAPSYRTDPDTSTEDEKYFGRTPLRDVKDRGDLGHGGADEDDDDEELDDTSAYVLAKRASEHRPQARRQPSAASQSADPQQRQRTPQPGLVPRTRTPGAIPPVPRSGPPSRQQSPYAVGGSHHHAFHQDSVTSFSGMGAAPYATDSPYQPPSRQQLYTRALRQADSDVGGGGGRTTSRDTNALSVEDDLLDSYSAIGASGSQYGGIHHGGDVGAGGGGGTWEEGGGRGWVAAQHDHGYRGTASTRHADDGQYAYGHDYDRGAPYGGAPSHALSHLHSQSRQKWR